MGRQRDPDARVGERHPALPRTRRRGSPSPLPSRFLTSTLNFAGVWHQVRKIDPTRFVTSAIPMVRCVLTRRCVLARSVRLTQHASSLPPFRVSGMLTSRTTPRSTVSTTCRFQTTALTGLRFHTPTPAVCSWRLQLLAESVRHGSRQVPGARHGRHREFSPIK